MLQIILEVSDETLAHIKKRLEEEDDIKVVHDPLAVLQYMLATEEDTNSFDTYLEYVLDAAHCSDGVAAEFGNLEPSIIEVEEQEDDEGDD